MCTDAIFEIAMLSSFDPKNRDLTRLTRCELMTSFVGKKKFPCVHREAEKTSAGEESIGFAKVLKRFRRTSLQLVVLN